MKRMKQRLPEEALAFFRRTGKIGGHKAADIMTPEERIERAKKASAKAAEVRSAKAAKKRAAATRRKTRAA